MEKDYKNLLNELSMNNHLASGLGDALMHIALVDYQDANGNRQETEWKDTVMRDVALSRSFIMKFYKLKDETCVNQQQAAEDSCYTEWIHLMNDHYRKLGMVLDEFVIKDNLIHPDKDTIEWMVGYIDDTVKDFEQLFVQQGIRLSDTQEMCGHYNHLKEVASVLTASKHLDDIQLINLLAGYIARARVAILVLVDSWRNGMTGFSDSFDKKEE